MQIGWSDSLGPEPSWHIQVMAGPREAACDHCKQLSLAGTELLEQGQTHTSSGVAKYLQFFQIYLLTLGVKNTSWYTNNPETGRMI